MPDAMDDAEDSGAYDMPATPEPGLMSSCIAGEAQQADCHELDMIIRACTHIEHSSECSAISIPLMIWSNLRMQSPIGHVSSLH